MSVIQAPIGYKERSASIPRRKSCRACAKAKRRCDLFLPVCSRCNQRGLDCEYPLLGLATSNIFEFAIHNNHHQPIITLHQQPPPPLPLPPLPPLSRSELKGAGGKSLSISSMHDSRFLAAMTRIQFTLDAFRNAHRTMVLDNETPWCHSQLYQDGMPRSMQDAYACCSLYMNRNTSNSKTILSIIENRAADLLASSPDHQSSSAIDCLARLQALILYQTIRLFDNDASARLAADLTMPALRSSLAHFLENVYLEDSLMHIGNFSMNSLLEEPLLSSSAKRDFWQSWIFEESARRTIFLAYFLIRLWEVISLFSKIDNNTDNNNKRGPIECDGKPGMSHHYWYMSSHLWEARTRYEFALAYAEKNRFLIRDLDFNEFLALGEPGDVDMFGKMVLSTAIGVEALRRWFLERGSVLD